MPHFDNEADIIAPTQASVTDLQIVKHLVDLHTGMPGIILSFNEDNQRAQVQPALKRFKHTDQGDKVVITLVDLPVLTDVLVEFPYGGDHTITFPVKAGDECWIQFSERPLGFWKELGGIQRPNQEGRRHHINDAKCMVGIRSNPNILSNFQTDGMEMRNNDRDQYIALKDSGDIEIESPANVVINAANTVTCDAVTTIICTSPTINFNASTSITADTPLFTITGNLLVNGGIGAGGSAQPSTGMAIGGAVNFTTGNVTINGIQVFNHNHTNPEGGNVGPMK